MKLSDLRKNVNGKITPAQREAGVLLKQLKLSLPLGFWVCYVKVKDILTDKHQRRRVPKHLRGLIKKYNPLYVNLPVLTCRTDGKADGMTLYAEDGWHTIGMIDAKEEFITLDDGTKVIQCLVNFDLNKMQAARLFSVHNSASKPPAKWRIFEAGYIGGDDSHEAIINTANRYGLSTRISGGGVDQPAKAQLQACNLFLKVVEKKGQGVRFLERLFAVHAKTWCREKIQKDYKVSDGFLKALIDWMEYEPMTITDWVAIINKAGRYQGIKELAEVVRDEKNAVRCDKMCFSEVFRKLIASHKRSVARQLRKAA